FSVVDGDLGAGGHDSNIYLSGGNIATRVWNTQTIASSGRNFADGQWHHAAHVVGEGGQGIYVDGSLVRRGSKSSSDFDWQRQIHIGFSNDGAGNYFEGQIDDVAVWSEALGPGHIRALSEGAHPLELGGLSSFVETDVEDSLRGVNSSVYLRIPFEASLPLDIDSLRLRVRFDDGFIAYLNGEELARRNAPDNAGYDSAALDDRPVAMALRQENIDITDRIDLLRDGENLLAVHGLNDAAESEDFLLLPELVGVAEFADRYFENPTPGSPNDAGGSAGFVADTSFSVDRGVYEQGFDVEITCATEEATIRYTLDGSEPTATRGTIYAGPLSVNGTTTLRAAAFKNG
ncbi:MAG: chitobiase/beta-hexosaminidase C-terminal domain-containing protein, partial [Planctomycetes bacterium]|nr:chitobiase/beta-hexosaminidase C-terminal domain-containing protein [Planctomycetota bacterium]